MPKHIILTDTALTPEDVILVAKTGTPQAITGLEPGSYTVRDTSAPVSGTVNAAAPVVTAPGQFASAQWSVATGDDPGEIIVSITGLPSTGGSAITGLVCRIGTGDAQALGAGVGTYPITGLTPGVNVSLQIAPVNAVGQGAWSGAKTVTAGAVAPEPVDPPTVITAPSITGAPTVGQTLTASEGTWNGSPTITLQWLRGTTAISGATGLTYVLTPADAGEEISVRATATNAGGSANATSAAIGPVTENSQPIAPIPGILDAANINVFGASFSKFAEADYAAVAAQFGFTGTVHMYAQAGLTSAAFPAQLASAVSADTVANSLSIVDFGGNDVTGSRPYPGGSESLDSRMRTNIDALIAGGSKPLIVPISFRYYTADPATATGTVWDWTITDETNGSKPYNDNIIAPLLETYNPDWVRPNGTPFLDAYNWTKGNQYFVSNDGVHPHAPDTFTASVLSKAAVRASGQDPDDKSRLYGKSILYVPRRNSGGGWQMYGGAAGATRYNGVLPLINTSTEQNTQRDHMVFGGICTDGTIASTGLIRMTMTGSQEQASNVTFNAGRLPDADIAAVQQVASSNVYVAAGNTYLVEFFDYPAGRTVDVTVAGQTNSAARPQTLTFSTGQTAEFNAGSDATSNLVTVSVVVPADGKFSFTMAGGATATVLSSVKAHIN